MCSDINRHIIINNYTSHYPLPHWEQGPYSPPHQPLPVDSGLFSLSPPFREGHQGTKCSAPPTSSQPTHSPTRCHLVTQLDETIHIIYHIILEIHTQMLTWHFHLDILHASHIQNWILDFLFHKLASPAVLSVSVKWHHHSRSCSAKDSKIILDSSYSLNLHLIYQQTLQMYDIRDLMSPVHC